MANVGSKPVRTNGPNNSRSSLKRSQDKRAPKVLSLCNSRPSPDRLNAFRDNTTPGLNRLLLDHELHLRKDSIVIHTGMCTYQSGFISGQPRILSSINMSTPGTVYLRKRIGRILRSLLHVASLLEWVQSGLCRGA